MTPTKIDNETLLKQSEEDPPAVLTPQQRIKALGLDPFPAAYEFTFEAARRFFEKSGRVPEMLIALTFEGGQPKLPLTFIEANETDVPELRRLALQRWPLVAYVFEVWQAPNDEHSPEEHPDREKGVALMLYTLDTVAVGVCNIDTERGTLVRGELRIPEELGAYYTTGFEASPPALMH